jgi:putative nucleotidyltransferase with HDIG domain
VSRASELAEHTALKESLLSIFRSPQYKPPVLPAIALELTELTRKSSVSYDEVVRSVAKDPLLVANVMQLAQSPLYGGKLRAQSLHDALNRLGLKTFRDLVWQVVLGLRIFRVQGYTSVMERLQLHSTFTAYAARVVANEAGIAGETAFLCGLLHDVGWSGMLIAVSERGPAPPAPETLFMVIDKLHAEVAATMGTLWGLSPEIVEVIAHHHDGDRAGQSLPPLVHVLCVAEQLAEELGFSIEPKNDPAHPALGVDENLVGRFEHALAQLRLEGKLDRLRQSARDLCERMRSATSGSAA